ncbi:MAG: hypothetical protein KAR33_03030 [Candidatus Thorarchaeota archaeon]|nr:hypothetical protein [Candidatus Thorarchaeota archaeon]
MSDPEEPLKKNQLIVVSLIMIIVTLVAPIAIICNGGGNTNGRPWLDLFFISVLWVFYLTENSNPWIFGIERDGFFFMEPIFLFNTVFLWAFSIVFAVQVIRFCNGSISQKRCLQFGIVSLLPPALFSLIGYMAVFQLGVPMYLGPLPIQFTIGYLLMRQFGPWDKENKLQWKETDDTWWENQDGSAIKNE